MKLIDEQVTAAKRELELRKRVYPGRVLQQRMTQAQSDHEIEAMQSIILTLTMLSDGTVPCLKLPDDRLKEIARSHGDSSQEERIILGALNDVFKILEDEYAKWQDRKQAARAAREPQLRLGV